MLSFRRGVARVARPPPLCVEKFNLPCLRIQVLYIAGIAFDFCVYWTAIDAIHLGYEVRRTSCFSLDTISKHLLRL